MLAAVPGQQHHGYAADFAFAQSGGRLPPGGIHRQIARVEEKFGVVQSAAAYEDILAHQKKEC